MSTRRNHRATSRSGFGDREQTADTAAAAGQPFGRASPRDCATSIRVSPDVSRPSRPPHSSPLHHHQGSGPHDLVLIPPPKFPLTSSYNVEPPYLKNAWPYPEPPYSPPPFPVPDPARPETPPSPSLIPLPGPLHDPDTPPEPKTPPTSPSPPPTPPAPKWDLPLEISVPKTISPHEQHDPLRYGGTTLGPRSPPGPPPDCPLPPTPPRPAPRPQPPNPPDTPPPDNDAERLSRIACRFAKLRPEQAEVGGKGVYYYYYHAPVVDGNGNPWYYTYLWGGSYWVLMGPFPIIPFPDGLKPVSTPEPEPLPPRPDTTPEKWRGISSGLEPELESQPEPEPTPRPDTPRPDTPEGGWISCGNGGWIWSGPVMEYVPAPQGSQEAKVYEKPLVSTSSGLRELPAPADADEAPAARTLGLRGGCGSRKGGRWWGRKKRRVRNEVQEEARMDRRPYENYHQDYPRKEGDTRRYEQNRVHGTRNRPYRSALSGGHNPYGELYSPFYSDEEFPRDNNRMSLARSGTLAESPDRGAWDEMDWTPTRGAEHHFGPRPRYPELHTSPAANRAESLILSPFSMDRSSTPSPTGPSSLAFWVTQPGEGGFQINFKSLRRDQRSGKNRRGYSPPPPSRYSSPEVSPRSSPTRRNRNGRRASLSASAQRWQQGPERNARRAASPTPQNRSSQHPYAYVVENPWPNRPFPQQELDSEEEAWDVFRMDLEHGVYRRSVSLPYGLQALYATHPTADVSAKTGNHPSTPRGPVREADRQRRVSEKQQQQQQQQEDATRKAPLHPNDPPSSSSSSSSGSKSSGSSTSRNQQDSQGLPYPDSPTDAAIALIYRTFLRTSLLSGVRATEHALPPPKVRDDDGATRHTGGPFDAERLAKAGCPSKYLPLLQDMVVSHSPSAFPFSLLPARGGFSYFPLFAD
ncbi:MAG: hypothetical protein M1824_001528 [Vezdaea acicularis]|nr:MAG: hypothetical protein M1824_001528 [Vezdaea acicularis]